MLMTMMVMMGFAMIMMMYKIKPWCWCLFHFLISLISQNPVARQGPEKSHWHVTGIGIGIFPGRWKKVEKKVNTELQKVKTNETLADVKRTQASF